MLISMTTLHFQSRSFSSNSRSIRQSATIGSVTSRLARAIFRHDLPSKSRRGTRRSKPLTFTDGRKGYRQECWKQLPTAGTRKSSLAIEAFIVLYNRVNPSRAGDKWNRLPFLKLGVETDPIAHLKQKGWDYHL